jgi:hypothetical protein
MEGSKKASAKSKKKADDEQEMIDTSSNQEFVDKMKKRATVKTHGIDNVRNYTLFYTCLACHF